MRTKNTLLIIIILAFVAGSCKQKAKVASVVPQTDIIPAAPVPAAHYSGVYTFGDSIEGAAEGTVYISQENDSSLLFYLYVNKGAPSYNCGEMDGRITVKGRKGTFRTRLGYSDADCVLYFEFNDSTVTINQDGNDCKCGFGNGVYVEDTFNRSTSETPAFYTTLSNDTISFSELQAQLQGMEMLKEFYTRYITVNSQTPPDSIYLEAIIENFITANLLAKIDSAMLDYDAFVNAQDYDMSWIESLEITPVYERPNTFEVCYTDNQENRNCLTLVLVKCWGNYMIDKIDGLDEIIRTFIEMADDETEISENESDE